MLREKLKLCMQRGIFSCSFCSMVWEQLYCFFYHGRPPPSLHAVLASTRCVSASLRLWTNCLRLWTVLLWTVVDCCVHLWIVVDCCGPLCTLVNHSMRRRETPRDFKHSQILRESRAIDRKNLRSASKKRASRSCHA